MRALAALSALTLAAGAASAFTDLDDPAEPWRHKAFGVTADVPSPFDRETIERLPRLRELVAGS